MTTFFVTTDDNTEHEMSLDASSSSTSSTYSITSPLSSTQSFAIAPSPLTNLASFTLSLTCNGKNIEVYYEPDKADYKETIRTLSQDDGSYLCEFSERNFPASKFPIQCKILSVGRDETGKKAAPSLITLSLKCPPVAALNAPPVPETAASTAPPNADLQLLKNQVEGLLSFSATAMGLVTKMQATVTSQAKQIAKLQAAVTELKPRPDNSDDATAKQIAELQAAVAELRERPDGS